MKCQEASRDFFFVFFTVFIVYLHFQSLISYFSAFVNNFDKKYWFYNYIFNPLKVQRYWKRQEKFQDYQIFNFTL